MSFSFFETSRFKGRPLNLYYFKTGDLPGDFIAFSDGERNITVGGVVYKAEPVKRSRIASSGSLDKAQLSINVSRKNPLFEIYRVYPPSYVVTVVVRQGHYGDPDNQFLAIWSGRIVDFESMGNEVSFKCEPAGTSARTPGLRRNMQRGCMHALYGPQCKAEPKPKVAEAAAVTGGHITLPAGWNGAIAAEKFVGGTIQWLPVDGLRVTRTVLDVSSDGLTLRVAGNTQGLAVGAEVTALAGCNHWMTDCKELHDNILNYGGCDWIPVQNPVGSTNQFY